MPPSPPIYQNGHIFPSSHPKDHSPASSASHGSCSPGIPSWLLSPTPEFLFNLTSFRQPSKIGPAFPFTLLPWEGVLCTTCPAWHRPTLGCIGRRGGVRGVSGRANPLQVTMTHQACGFLFTSPRCRLHWEWGLRWYVSCRQSFSMVPSASPSCKANHRWVGKCGPCGPRPPPPASCPEGKT